MPAYKAPLREFRYVLHDVLGATAHYRALGRDDINVELVEGVLESAARFAEDVLARRWHGHKAVWRAPDEPGGAMIPFPSGYDHLRAILVQKATL